MWYECEQRQNDPERRKVFEELKNVFAGRKGMPDATRKYGITLVTEAATSERDVREKLPTVAGVLRRSRKMKGAMGIQAEFHTYEDE